jgi:hypothetical protein
MRVRITYLMIAAVCSFLILKPASLLAAKGESLLNKGDSIAVYVDAEDFEAIKAAKAGATVKIKVLENIVRSGEKLVNKGEAVFATVTGRSHGGMYGGAGNAKLAIDSTHSNGKTKIPLRGSITIKGKSSTPKTVISVVLFPIGWLIKGGDIEFPEGKNVFKPVVADDTPVYYQR